MLRTPAPLIGALGVGGPVMDTSQILWGVFFSSVGFGYFLYGKKQKALVPLLSGLLLMCVPYFISNSIWLVVTGVALGAVPFFIKI